MKKIPPFSKNFVVLQKFVNKILSHIVPIGYLETRENISKELLGNHFVHGGNCNAQFPPPLFCSFSIEKQCQLFLCSTEVIKK